MEQRSSMSHLTKETVLVLNKNWQAIHVKTPEAAFGMIFSGVATALHIQGMDNMTPCSWAEWSKIPIEEDDDFIHTVRGKIKIPKVIILCNYGEVPRKRPKFSSRTIWERDQGICQYTGKKLTPNEGNIDHVVPRSKGGKTSFDNCVLASKKINTLKADRTPSEAGLKLLKEPVTPRIRPTGDFIRNRHKIKEWDHFLDKTKHSD